MPERAGHPVNYNLQFIRSGRMHAKLSVRVRYLMFELRDLILDSEFLALQLGDFGVAGGRMSECVRQFRLQRLVLCREFTEMRLK